MEKFYSNSEEKYLKGVLLYAISAVGGDSIGLFYDAEGTQPSHNSDYDWEDLFLKGLIRVRFMDAHSGTRDFCVPYRFLADSEGFVLQLDEDTKAEFFPDESEDQIPLDPGDGGKL